MSGTATDLKPAEVADYLRQHPEFLAGFPELAAQLRLPHEQGPVASLATYQLQALRDKNAEMERRLTELVGIAADNEKLMLRVHDLNVTLLRAATPAIAARSLVTRLAEDFHIDQVRLVLFSHSELPPADWLIEEPRGRSGLPEFADFLAHHEPIAGRLTPERLQRLFGSKAGDVRSAAVMPLAELGLLAIGSSDPDHFQPGMGNLFLHMIAGTVTAALARGQDGV